MFAEISIILSVGMNLLATELVGISGGGIVVPGYLALYLDQPWRLAATFFSALITLAAVRLLMRFIVLYGRRRFTAMLLVGILVNSFISSQLLSAVAPVVLRGEIMDWRVIGYVIPGLIANDMMRQGVVNTILMTLVLAMIIRIVLIYVFSSSGIWQAVS